MIGLATLEGTVTVSLESCSLKAAIGVTGPGHPLDHKGNDSTVWEGMMKANINVKETGRVV